MTPDQEYNRSQERTKEAIQKYKRYLWNKLGGVEIRIDRGPKYADYDYEVYIEREFNHYLEVKTRRNRYGKYSRTKLPLRKHTFAKFMYEKGTESYFVCDFVDKTGLLKLWEDPDFISTQLARYDRGEDEDLYAFYDIRRFYIL